MNNAFSFSPETLARLTLIYEEMMWLAARPHNKAGAARAWYSHIAAGPIIKHVRRFTGKVSLAAIADPHGRLVLEHFNRLQSTLTELVTTHLKSGINDPESFFRLVEHCEQVHIVTERQNHDARRAKGDYMAAGISLEDWSNIPQDIQVLLHSKKLRGHVSNALAYAPRGTA